MKSGIKNINERIKSIRKHLGLTQEEFAKPLGIGQGHMTDIERGTRNPSDTLLIALSYRYAVNPLYLYEGKGETFIGHGEVAAVAEEGAPYGIDKDIKEMIEKINYIYRWGTEDQKSLLYGQVGRIYNKLLEEKEKSPGGQADEGSDRTPERFPGAEEERKEPGAPGKVQKPA
jgi:transcriptional regulator with XRE-family HTH domain